MLIKGKFVAQVEIDISVDENTPGLLPFEAFAEAVRKEQCAALQNMLDDEYGDIGTIKVKQLFADAWLEGVNLEGDGGNG